jgi:glycosyltransferase involved in cell wall biosynthesis
VEDGKNGFVIKTRDPADLAARMLQALDLPRDGIRATIPYDYTLECMVEQTLEVYRDLLANPA